MEKKVQTHPLISVRSSATVQEAARLMADCSIAALGVLDGHKSFIGILTERDLAWFVAQGRDAVATPVKDIVNDFPVVVGGPLDEAAALERMKRARIRHLIVRENEEFRIVSLRDFLSTSMIQPREPIVTDAMTAPAIACRDDAFFEEVAETLADRDISGMPVVDAIGRVVGVISERDLAYAWGGPMVRLALRRHKQRTLHDLADLPRGERRARDIMTAPAITVSSIEPLDEVARLMRMHQINRLPVVDRDLLTGVVTRGDVLACVGHVEHPAIDLGAPPVLAGSAGARLVQGMYE